jgi:hypothetical protein
VLTLAEVQERHYGGFFVLWGVALCDFVDEFEVDFIEFEGEGRVVDFGVTVLDDVRKIGWNRRVK